MTTDDHRAGFVTFLGRPNVGKSTLLNALLGEKIAIVTPKPQTTRDRILGIRPVEGGQLVFVDTPGVHRGRSALNQHMTEVAVSSVEDVDAVAFVADAAECGGSLPRRDREVHEIVVASGKPAVAVLNKVDLANKAALLPLIEELAASGRYAAIVPVSAVTGDGLDALLGELIELVPAGPPLFDPDELTDKPMRFIAAELLREQLMLSLGDELPYSVAVEITRFKQRPDRALIDIDATIHVERSSQKGIVLGKGGARMREVATAARAAMEELVGQQVFLRTHVRVEPNWTKSEKGLRKLGYTKKR